MAVKCDNSNDRSLVTMRGNNMQRYRLLKSVIVLASAVLITACVQTVVGSDKDRVIDNMSFTVDSTFIQYNRMYARGTVTNNSNVTASPVWYIEGQFYGDSSMKLKLGGSNTSITVPLESGQSTIWQISFTTEIVDVNDYPDFVVGDLRAIYKGSN